MLKNMKCFRDTAGLIILRKIIQLLCVFIYFTLFKCRFVLETADRCLVFTEMVKHAQICPVMART